MPGRDTLDVELWFIDLEACGPALDVLEQATPRLSAAELYKIGTPASQRMQRERRAAYIAQRVLIERLWGPASRGVGFSVMGTGKPSLVSIAPGSFNLAHVERYALVALSRSVMIGVDLEPRRTPSISESRSKRMEEAAHILAPATPLPDEPVARFLRAWVRLESVAKSDGRGIGRVLTGLGIVGATPSEAGELNLPYMHSLAERFNVIDVNVPHGCVAAIAIDQGEGNASVRAAPTAALDARIFPTGPGAITALLSDGTS
jgi:4'-phosphopantetheinyl transferase